MSAAGSAAGRGSGAALSATSVLTGLRQLATPLSEGGLAVLEDAWLLSRDGLVVEVGTGSPPAADERVDGGDRVALPGFVDSHTHAVFGRSRADEMERRLAGESYARIADSGGGILASVADLRGRSEDDLVELALPRLRAMLASGTTTAEVKSGYGLSTADELKALRAVRRLRALLPLDLVPTFLGAHAVPREFAGDRAAYVRLLVDEMLPAVAAEGLAEFCDCFCDEGAFTAAEAETVLATAAGLGLGLKLHADEFASLGATELAVRLGAASADHLLRVTPQAARALGGSRTVATLLPGTAFFLGLPYAPARLLRESGATLALATDFNPGSSPCASMAVVWSLACCGMGLPVGDALVALTHGGARALGRAAELGCLLPGFRADVALFDVADYREIPYFFGENRCALVLRGGRRAWSREDLPAPAG
ncbi:MAG: imidazolonepropionase [Gemmatimonadota bacterium]